MITGWYLCLPKNFMSYGFLEHRAAEHDSSLNVDSGTGDALHGSEPWQEHVHRVGTMMDRRKLNKPNPTTTHSIMYEGRHSRCTHKFQ